ncbi:MAG: hypothetical protein JXQ75_12255, partial [Phycisphaerae bacterium]|nr:hypothetical protein [Phycisphaerae bacterium]
STNLGWICGFMYDGGRYCNVSTILKTDGNGGTNWTFLTPGSAYELTPLYDIDFVDANNGWIAADSKGIIRSSNGGTTWTPQTNGLIGPIRGLDFASATTGWAYDGSYERIFKTSNGGSTWVQQYQATNTYLYRLRCGDANVALACGGYYNTGKVFRTINGGSGWSEIIVGTNYLYDLFFLDSANVFVCGAQGAMFKSTDSGGTWTPIPVPTSSDLNSMCWIDSQTGWVSAGPNGGLYRTDNGGATWTYDWGGFYGTCADMVMLTADLMFIAMDTPYNTPGVYRSLNASDANPTWTRMNTDANEYHIDHVRWTQNP